ncbi:MAG: hypothetical protein K2M01_00995, partial [Paramuribaculum sp.]|nr:hypothetical protein [Paramuribaculum sp.]
MIDKVEIAYKGFCWSLGTTSFRTKDFNRTIESQIEMLSRFWELPENRQAAWNNEIEVIKILLNPEKGMQGND